MSPTGLPHGFPSELITGLDVRGASSVSGGDIASAYRLETPDGPVFAKTHPRPTPGLFEREAAGLRALREHAPTALRVPQVLRESANGLVLEWIPEGGRRTGHTERTFGEGLAKLHRTTSDAFGGLDGVDFGYLGSAEVDLTPSTDWAEFYVERRVAPLVERAIGMRRLDPHARDLLDAVRPRAQELCGPVEPPALLHGDLWAGNRLVDSEGTNWLIDPSAHWGHREYDLAMMQLFGGFGAECYEAYDAEVPLGDGWRDRTPWYQLTPLLVHAILFGGSYGDAALRSLARYA
ncbi:MAG: fructosamine kinase family protein [Dermatophilus congolensis]|nr:fructosamine kinase family protein [Dermatophilus congolensis]